MAKLLKWLMVLFIPLFSLTFTSCGDDDKDEPKTPDVVPNRQFLVGEWRQGTNCTINFDANGNYTGKVSSKTLQGHLITQEDRGTWKYSKGIISVDFNRYSNSTFQLKGSASCHVMWDEYTNTLIFYDFIHCDGGNTPIFGYGFDGEAVGQFHR